MLRLFQGKDSMAKWDVIVVGAGVIGTSVAWHLARLGARKVLVIEQGQVGSGTTAQSSGILRTHYSVAENVDLAQRSWSAFKQFDAYLDDEDASSGLVQCGYLIAAPSGDKLDALRQSLLEQQAKGITLEFLSPTQAQERLPIAHFDDAALIGYEPDAGFADAYLVTTGFARAARRLGVQIQEGVRVDGLIRDGVQVVGVQTSTGPHYAGCVISTQNIWSAQLQDWTGIDVPLRAERHSVLALEGPQAYTHHMPVFKDLGSVGMLYCRSYGGNQMLVSEGTTGEHLQTLINEQGDITMDQVVEIGQQVAQRFPSFAEAGLASSWTGIYDVTPDWNPVLGRLPDVPGLIVGFGFSGHGFKLSPAVGRILAQEALYIATDVSLVPYAYERFRKGKLLIGRYGQGAVS